MPTMYICMEEDVMEKIVTDIFGDAVFDNFIIQNPAVGHTDPSAQAPTDHRAKLLADKLAKTGGPRQQGGPAQSLSGGKKTD